LVLKFSSVQVRPARNHTAGGGVSPFGPGKKMLKVIGQLSAAD